MSEQENQQERTIAEVLKNPVFSTLSQEELHVLVRHSKVLSLKHKELVFKKHDVIRSVFAVITGKIRVFHAHDNVEFTVTHLGAPSTFGEMEVVAEHVGMLNSGYLECAEAIHEAELLEIPKNIFLEQLDHSHGMTRRLLEDVCSRFCASALRESDFLLDVPARLARLLLHHAEEFGRTHPKGVQIRLPLTLQDLADSLGVNIKSIVRTMKQWSANGWVGREKGWILILASESLQTLGQDPNVIRYRFGPKS